MLIDTNYKINLLKLGFDIISINKINKLIVNDKNCNNNDTTINEEIIDNKYNPKEFNNNNNNNNNTIGDDLDNSNIKYDSPEIMRCNQEFSQLNLSDSFYDDDNNNNNNNNNNRLSVSIAFSNHCIDEFSPIINYDSIIFDNNEYNHIPINMHIDSLNSNLSSFQYDNIQERIISHNCNISNDLSQEYETQNNNENYKEKTNDYNINDPISEYNDYNSNDDNYNSQVSVNSEMSVDSEFPITSRIGMLKYCNKDLCDTSPISNNNNNNNNNKLGNLVVPIIKDKKILNKEWDQYFSSHVSLDESNIDDDLIINSNIIDNNTNSLKSPIWIRQHLTLTNKLINNKNKNKKINNTKAYYDVLIWMEEVHKQIKISIMVYSLTTKLNVFDALIETCLNEWNNFNSTKTNKKKSSIKQGGILIITSKASVEIWADLIRNRNIARLHVYNESISKRRKYGVSNLCQNDFIVTTIDILRTKECCIQESNLINNYYDKENSSSFNNNTNNTNNISDSNNSANSSWINARNDGLMLERSYLHLIQWHKIIVDFDSQTNIKATSARGSCLTYLNFFSKLGLFIDKDVDEIDAQVKNINNKEINNVYNLIDINRKYPLSAITLDARI